MKKSILFTLFLALSLSNFAQWANVLNPYSSSAFAASVAVDQQGYIYSAGYAFKNSTEKDNYFLVKYTSLGDTLWTRKYNRSNQLDQIVKIIVDADNNVIVTGTSNSSTNGDDIVTLKYNPNGDVLNTYIFDGTNHLADKALDVFKDTDGNYYIAGTTRLTAQNGYALIKTNSALQRKWARTFTAHYGAVPRNTDYNSAEQKIAITGNLTDWDNRFLIGTIVYDSAGTKLWDHYYRKIDDRSAVGFDVAFGTDQSVYVCGYEANAVSNKWDAILVKYNSTGDTLWTRKFYANNKMLAVFKSIIVDQSGNVFTTGMWENTVITAKYNSNGDQLWLNEHAGKESFSTSDTRESIKMDNSGNILVMARNFHAAGGGVMLIKYSSAGNHLWTKYYNGSASQMDEPIAFGIDATNSVYIAANSRNSNFYMELATIKFTPNSPTSINSNEFYNYLQVYPNPSCGSVNFIPFKSKSLSLKVFSNIGQLVHSERVVEGQGNINLNHLPNGIYSMVFSNLHQRFYSKIVIQK
jgi:hypothetical protein